jgi:hypothetical protein
MGLSSHYHFSKPALVRQGGFLFEPGPLHEQLALSAFLKLPVTVNRSAAKMEREVLPITR